MKKRVTPLRAGRAHAQPSAKFWDLNPEKAPLPYPFEEISPDLEVKISDRARRMALRLDPKKRVVNLVVPKRASLRNAYYFARENSAWIQEKVANLPKPVSFSDGSILPIFGRNRKIIVLYNSALKYTDIQLKKNEILVLTNKEDPASRIRRFLIEQAKERMSTMAHEKAQQIRRKVKSLSFRDTHSRWGSCSEDGKISLSWRLMFAPAKAMDYVVAHEVAHLVHMDHSDAFWRICERLSKDYDYGRDWMRENGHELMRYGD